jgi:hypothetical protein
MSTFAPEEGAINKAACAAAESLLGNRANHKFNAVMLNEIGLLPS